MSGPGDFDNSDPRPTLRGGLIDTQAASTEAASTEAASTEAASTEAVGGPIDVGAENRRPGTEGWRISRSRGSRPGLAGYAGAVSVRPGEPVPIVVRASGSVRFRALRIGWYGGAGAREVSRGAIRAPRTEVDTQGWPEGHYLLRLDHAGASRYLPLTVRSADTRGRVVLLSSPLTWQASNRARTLSTATDTETGAETGAEAGVETGAEAGVETGAEAGVETGVEAGAGGQPRLVTFDRPYDQGYGSGGFLENEVGLVQQAERTGRRLSYATDVDVATSPELIGSAAAVLTGGDSRFWTGSLRSAIQTAVNSGTNVASFGAGAGSRQVRLLPGGRRVEFARQEVASLSFTGVMPSCATAAGSAEEDAAGSAESVVQRRVGGGDWVVADPDWWGYAETGLRAGERLPDLLGAGVDRAARGSAHTLGPVQVLSSGRLRCGPEAVVQSAVYLVLSSGAGSFSAGTGRWACALADACLDSEGEALELDRRSRRAVGRITRTVITAFDEPAAGLRHPVPGGPRPHLSR